MTTNKTLLIKCPRCEAGISPDAATCPQCGDPQHIGDAQARLTCEACETWNAAYLQDCRGCGKSLTEELGLFHARQDNRRAYDKRGQFTFWGAVIGFNFPGMPLNIFFCNPHTTVGLIVGLILMAVSAAGVAYIGRNVARQLFPYRHTANMPDWEKQDYTD